MRRVTCPFCGGRADKIVYGLLPGPPLSGEVAGGCCIFPGESPDFLCPHCEASWLVFDDCLVVLTSLGINQADAVPRGAVLIDHLERAASSLREEMEAQSGLSNEEIMAMATSLGLALGLDERQSEILLDYVQGGP